MTVQMLQVNQSVVKRSVLAAINLTNTGVFSRPARGGVKSLYRKHSPSGVRAVIAAVERPVLDRVASPMYKRRYESAANRRFAVVCVLGDFWRFSTPHAPD
jgi:hypothetical protein